MASALINTLRLTLPTAPITPSKPGPPIVVPDSTPIPRDLYVSLLDPRVPLTIAAVYAVTVHFANSRANGKPYRIANSRLFKWFVVLHNVFLAVYSAWTFVGMVHGVHVSLDKSSLRGVVGSLCRIRGETRGVLRLSENGNSTTSAFGDTVEGMDMAVKVGGLWEEALAYYGWWFYLSKFYEVVDTAVILLKGKKSSLLQTYHHAGAMICMWAGIRYMAPPIWLFCSFNSLIHALMYTYYTLSALRIPVPNMLKRSLTSLQITQFVVGGSFAALHLFVKMDLAGVGEYIPCLSNEGEVFAVMANCAYLTPLTWLFVDFFLRSYRGKGKDAKKA